MIYCTKDELLKLAKLSSLKLSEEEIQQFGEQLEVLLTYLNELNEVRPPKGQEGARSINVFREDRIIQADPTLAVEQAPRLEGTSIIVPKILE